MRKKMMLFAMAAGALVAFAAPSMASGAEWYTSGTKLGTSQGAGDTVHLTGTMTTTKSGLKTTCEATSISVLWNEGGIGVGEKTLSRSGPCTVAVLISTNWVHVAGCSATPSSEGENWPISTSGSAVSIEEANFTNEFQGCAAIGIPNGTKIGDSGTLTGAVAGEGVVFSESGDLSGGTKVDGVLTAPGLELK